MVSPSSATRPEASSHWRAGVRNPGPDRCGPRMRLR
ncbi:uncharacterized protein Dere_GG27052 [Drosophila erecta]|uniref:Uncharacterized protein n=1 Tax=Drosophila erecta TaxID=7220 RepID=A0A0Q5UH22_DROER|nr:uncharacterized protein Dere_GG27052 [Drosophila erecta]